jgi:putative ABC transport system permease protein
VKALRHKLLRDLVLARGPLLAVTAVVACGVATFVGSVTAAQALQRSQAAWYAASRFPDAFARVRRAPAPVARRLAAIAGVAEVETRILADALVELPGRPAPASALLTSLPPSGAPRLGQLHVRRGRLVAPGRAGEVLVNEAFADANRLRPGDGMAVLVNGRRIALRVAGVVLSPEHVMALRPGAVVNDDVHYGVLWTDERSLAAAMDLTGAFNTVVLRLAPGAREAAVLEQVDRILAPHGGLGAHGRDQQTSHRLVSDEISQMHAMAAALPPIVLGVAAFLLSVVLSRLVAVQRPQIATLKALGYSGRAVGGHFAGFAVALAAAGAALGVAGGWWMGSGLADTFARFYRFPAMLYSCSPIVIAAAATLAVGGALVGASGAVWRAVRLHPAEGLQPAAPPDHRPTAAERLGLGRLLSPAGRMVMRDLGRRPWRTALSAAGIAAAMGTQMLGAATSEAARTLIAHQFERASREDVDVTFTMAVSDDAVRGLRALPGVIRAEPYRAVPVRLRAGHRTYLTQLVALEPPGRLRRVIDGRGRTVPIPARGLVISRYLVERLHLAAGDPVRVEVLDGRRPAREMPVAVAVDDLLGIQVVASRAAVDELLGEARLATGALLAVDPARVEAVQARLLEGPRVAGVALHRASRAAVVEMLEESLVWFTRVLTLLAAVVVAGVVYNAARLSVAERERELATLRVVGFTRAEVWAVLATEIAAQVGLALAPAWFVGRGFAALMAAVLASETLRLPQAVTAASYCSAALVASAAAVAVLAVAWRWLARLDLVSALKARE